MPNYKFFLLTLVFSLKMLCNFLYADNEPVKSRDCETVFTTLQEENRTMALTAMTGPNRHNVDLLSGVLAQLKSSIGLLEKNRLQVESSLKSERDKFREKFHFLSRLGRSKKSRAFRDTRITPKEKIIAEIRAAMEKLQKRVNWLKNHISLVQKDPLLADYFTLFLLFNLQYGYRNKTTSMLAQSLIGAKGDLLPDVKSANTVLQYFYKAKQFPDSVAKSFARVHIKFNQTRPKQMDQTIRVYLSFAQDFLSADAGMFTLAILATRQGEEGIEPLKALVKKARNKYPESNTLAKLFAVAVYLKRESASGLDEIQQLYELVRSHAKHLTIRQAGLVAQAIYLRQTQISVPDAIKLVNSVCNSTTFQNLKRSEAFQLALTALGQSSDLEGIEQIYKSIVYNLPQRMDSLYYSEVVALADTICYMRNSSTQVMDTGTLQPAVIDYNILFALTPLMHMQVNLSMGVF